MFARLRAHCANCLHLTEKHMKILVPIKRVIDPYVKIRIKSDYSGIEKTKCQNEYQSF